MAIIKCKMCGGDLEITAGQSVAECEYCGSRQTIPSADNEKKLTLFSRANRLRLSCEFDKAAGVYEALVADFPEEAEAYWGLVLCKYGIEYVDDPATGRKIPTCHRSSFDSIMDDSNLEQALENADAVARKLYREEAKQIEKLRKGIIEVSGREEPYDIFICYKETAEDGGRTLDSVLAQDVYDALTKKGYRVFFSRITLEDKLGQEYEPYIFAALNSAKIMLAFGTDYEYFNAVWVKNEWSRYLQLMTQDKSKHLIPCYKGLDAYDMPKEFAKLQAQDLGKVGAVQDLLRGIEKLLPKQGKAVGASAETSTNALVKRGYIYLEDGEFKKATEYFERGLDENPEDSDAYLGKVMATRKVRNEEALGTMPLELAHDKDFQRALRYADAAQKQKLEGIQRRNYAAALVNMLNWYRQKNDACITAVRNSASRWTGSLNVAGEHLQAGTPDETMEDRIVREYILEPYLGEDTIREGLSFDFSYTSMVSGWQRGKNKALEELAQKRRRLEGKVYAWRDLDRVFDESQPEIEAHYDKLIAEESARDEEMVRAIMDRYEMHLKELTKVRELRAKAETARREDYETAMTLFQKDCCLSARRLFEKTAASDYLESRRMIGACDRRMAQIEEEKAAELARREAEEKAEAERLEALRRKEAAAQARKNKKIKIIVATAVVVAIAIFLLVTRVIIPAVRYGQAEKLLESGAYEDAIEKFEALDDYSDSAAKIDKAKEGILVRDYAAAMQLLNSGAYEEAKQAFEALGDYQDASSKVLDCIYEKAQNLVSRGLYEEAIAVFESIADHRDSNDQIQLCYVAMYESTYQEAVELQNAGEYARAAILFGSIPVYKDALACSFSLWEKVTIRNTAGVGDGHTVAVRNDGTVLAVGYNKNGETNVSDWTDIIAIETGNAHTVGLRSDGTVVATGSNEQGQCNVRDWENIVAISAGSFFTIGLKADGTVVETGARYGGHDVSQWKNIIAIESGCHHTVGIQADGTVIATGSNKYGQCEVSSWENIVFVAAGGYHTLGLRSDGTVVATKVRGEELIEYGQDNVSEWTDIVAIAAGYLHSYALKEDGTIVTAGRSDYKVFDMDDWTDIAAIISCFDFNSTAIKKDGTILVAGSEMLYGSRTGQFEVDGWTDIKIPNT